MDGELSLKGAWSGYVNLFKFWWAPTILSEMLKLKLLNFAWM